MTWYVVAMNEDPDQAQPLFPEPQSRPSVFAADDVVVPLSPTPERPFLTEEMLHASKRRVAIPVTLFILACFSTFWAGATIWSPFVDYRLSELRLAVVANWRVGLTYMACVIGILVFHEMGHFLMTLRFRIPASLPYFIPFPISPIGTKSSESRGFIFVI